MVLHGMANASKITSDSFPDGSAVTWVRRATRGPTTADEIQEETRGQQEHLRKAGFAYDQLVSVELVKGGLGVYAEFESLWAAIKLGRVRAIAVSQVGRLARFPDESVYHAFVRDCNEHQCDLIVDGSSLNVDGLDVVMRSLDVSTVSSPSRANRKRRA